MNQNKMDIERERNEPIGLQGELVNGEQVNDKQLNFLTDEIQQLPIYSNPVQLKDYQIFQMNDNSGSHSHSHSRSSNSSHSKTNHLIQQLDTNTANIQDLSKKFAILNSQVQSNLSDFKKTMDSFLMDFRAQNSQTIHAGVKRLRQQQGKIETEEKMEEKRGQTKISSEIVQMKKLEQKYSEVRQRLRQKKPKSNQRLVLQGLREGSIKMDLAKKLLKKSEKYIDQQIKKL